CTYSNVSSDRADQGARSARSEGRARDYGAIKGGSRKGIQPSRLNSAVLQLDIVLFEFAPGAISRMRWREPTASLCKGEFHADSCVALVRGRSGVLCHSIAKLSHLQDGNAVCASDIDRLYP